MKRSASDRLIWFAVLGGPLAWTVQFVAGLFFTWAQCNAPPGRWLLPVHGWQIGLSAAAGLITLAAAAVSLSLFLRTRRLDHIAEMERRGEGSPPPTGRINFLSMVGLTVNFLSFAIIAMTGVGLPLLPVCQQS